MIDLTNMQDVRTLQMNLRASLGTDAGKEVMTFLEELCFWYDFKETDTNLTLIGNGRRQVLATIKTLLEKSPEEIVVLAKKEE